MFGTSEHELFAQAVGGDWRSRGEFYKKFVHANPRIRRLCASYSDINDFLHDCFTNILRTAESSVIEGSVSDWIESVAVYTALERERLTDIDDSGATGFVRMCAASEADEPAGRARLASYFPPRQVPEDSLSTRIAALVGEPQFTLMRTLAVENATWEDAAAAADRPVNAIGPILVRAIDRLSRFFGAPPLLNDDLEPVFPEVSTREAAARGAGQLKPAGRVVAMQLDPLFYALTPEARRIGLTFPAEVRTIALWDAARIKVPSGLRDHLDQCHYCADVLRSLRRMQRALLSEPSTGFALCPGASTLLQGPGPEPLNVHPPLARHLEECAACREELMRVLSGAGADGRARLTFGTSFDKKVAWVAAAAVILAGVFFFATRNHRAPVAAEVQESSVSVNDKYAALADPVTLNDPRLMASLSARNQLMFMEAQANLRQGNLPEAALVAQRLVNEFHDPGGQLLYAACVYSWSASQGYREMQKAEAMSPRNPFRCWSTLQLALRVGDKATVEREVEHLYSDPDFGVHAKEILARMRAMK